MLATYLYETFAPAEYNLLNRSGALFAKFTPGAIVSEVRGTIAATTYARNKGGAVIRNRIVPINRRSNLQSTRRQILASLSSSFRGLTQTQISGWNSAALNFPISDNLGQTIYLSGQQLYVRFNANLGLIGAAAITNAPAPTSFAIIALTTLTATAGTGAITVAFSPTVPAGYALAMFATRPLSAGKSFVGESEFRFLESLPAAEVTPADIAASYATTFGAITASAGQKIFVKAFLIETTSGIAGQSVRTSGVIA